MQESGRLAVLVIVCLYTKFLLIYVILKILTLYTRCTTFSGKVCSTGCNRQFRKIYEFKMQKELVFVLKQTISKTKALLFSFHREDIKKIIQRGILQSLRIQVEESHVQDFYLHKQSQDIPKYPDSTVIKSRVQKSQDHEPLIIPGNQDFLDLFHLFPINGNTIPWHPSLFQDYFLYNGKS